MPMAFNNITICSKCGLDATRCECLEPIEVFTPYERAVLECLNELISQNREIISNLESIRYG